MDEAIELALKREESKDIEQESDSAGRVTSQAIG